MIRPIGIGLAIAIAIAGCGGGTKAGYVWVDSFDGNQDGMPRMDASAVAQFVANRRSTASPTDPTSACSSIVRAGPCAAYSACSTTSKLNVIAPTESAGVITVGGALVPLVLRPDSTPFPYSSGELGQPGWQGGETITFAATGGAIPAFAGQVTAPAAATITAPALTQLQGGTLSVTVDRSQDLAFTWTPTAPATLGVALGNEDVTVFCDFDATAGQGALPAQLLQLIPAGIGNMGADSDNEEIVAAGDWSLTLEAQSLAVTPNATSFQGQVIFQ